MIKDIVNIKTGKPYDVYIGRYNPWFNLPESKWHNPFKIKSENQRVNVINQYRGYILEQKDLLNSLEELENKILGCYCYPKLCHGNILAELLQLKKLGIL